MKIGNFVGFNFLVRRVRKVKNVAQFFVSFRKVFFQGIESSNFFVIFRKVEFYRQFHLVFKTNEKELLTL